MQPAKWAILWDVGGTLVEFACSLPESVRQRLDGTGLDLSRISDERIEQTYAAFISDEPHWTTIEQERAAERRWLTELLTTESLVSELVDRTAATLPRYFGMYRPVPGILQLLEEIAARGISMAIVSNWPPSLPEFLAYHGLLRYFLPVVFSAQDGIHKPDPRIFLPALHPLALPAERAIFIGDNPSLDILPAQSLGMQTICFDPRRRLSPGAIYQVAVLRDKLLGMLG